MGWIVMAMAVLMVVGSLLWLKPPPSKNTKGMRGGIRQHLKKTEEGDAGALKQENRGTSEASRHS